MSPEEMDPPELDEWDVVDDDREEPNTAWSIVLPQSQAVRELQLDDPNGAMMLASIWGGYIQGLGKTAEEPGEQPPVTPNDAHDRLVKEFPKFLSTVRTEDEKKSRWLNKALNEHNMSDEAQLFKMFYPSVESWHVNWRKATPLSRRQKIAEGLKDLPELMRDGDIYTGFTGKQFTLAHMADKSKHTLRSLSKSLNKGPGYLHTFCAQGSPRKLDFYDAIALEGLLDLPQFSLCDDDDVAIMKKTMSDQVSDGVVASSVIGIPMTGNTTNRASETAYQLASGAIKHLQPVIQEKDAQIGEKDKELHDLHTVVGGLRAAMDTLEEQNEQLARDDNQEMQELRNQVKVLDKLGALYGDVAAGQVPEYDAKAEAGAGYFNDVEKVVEKWRMPPMYLMNELEVTHPGHLHIISIKGDSMKPTLENGDKVMVDVGQTAVTPPGIFVVWDGNGLVCKRLEYIPRSDQINIMSDNPLHSTYSVTIDEAEGGDFRIVGRVVWMSRKMS